MDIKKRRELIVSGNLYKVILSIILPLMVSEVIQRAYTLTDMYFLSRLGSNEVAAITFVDPILTGILAIGVGLSIPMISLVSKSIGAKNYEGARESIGHLLYLATIISSIIAIASLVATPGLLRALKLEGELLESATIYLKTVLLGSIFTFINTCYISVKQAQGDTMKPLYLNIASLILNITLNPIFIFNLKLGILGAALATVLSKGLLAIYGMWDMFKGKSLKIERRHLKMTKDEFKTILAIGGPAIIAKLASPIGNIIINTHAISYGASLIAAVGLGNKINSIFFSLNTSFSKGMQTITGQNIGNNSIPRIEEAVRKMALVCIGVSIVSVSIVLLNINTIIGVFTNEVKVVSYTREFLFITTPTILMWGAYQIVSGVYQGAGYTKVSMYITLIRLWAIRIPAVFILDNFIGGRSMWYSTAIATNIIGVLSILVYISGRWKGKPSKMESI